MKKYQKTVPIREAVDRAVNEAIAVKYLDGFFRKHKGGVMDITLAEFDEKQFIESQRKEEFDERFIKGVNKGIEN